MFAEILLFNTLNAMNTEPTRMWSEWLNPQLIYINKDWSKFGHCKLYLHLVYIEPGLPSPSPHPPHTSWAWHWHIFSLLELALVDTCHKWTRMSGFPLIVDSDSVIKCVFGLCTGNHNQLTSKNQQILSKFIWTCCKTKLCLVFSLWVSVIDKSVQLQKDFRH